MSRSPKVMLPDVGDRTPESKLKSVVFPAPFGPMITRNSPSRTSIETPSTIRTPPMRNPSPSVRNTGGAAI